MIKILTLLEGTELIKYLDRREFEVIKTDDFPDMIIGKSCTSHKLVNNMKDTYHLYNCAGTVSYPLYCLPNSINISREFELTQKNKLVSAGINTPVAFFSSMLKSFLSHTYTGLDSLYVLSLSGTTRGYGKWLMTKRNIITLFEYVRTFEGDNDTFMNKLKELSLRYNPRYVTFEGDISSTIHSYLYSSLSDTFGIFPYFVMESLTDNLNLLEHIREYRVLLFKSYEGTNYIICKRDYSPFTKIKQDTYIYNSDVLRNNEVRPILYEKHRFLKEVDEFVNDKLIPFFYKKVNVPYLAMDVYCNPTKDNNVLELGVFEYDSTPNVVYPAETYIKTSKTTGVSLDWTCIMTRYVTQAMKQHIKEM